MPARAKASRRPDVIDQAVGTGLEIANGIYAIPGAAFDQSVRAALQAKDALKSRFNPDEDDIRLELLRTAERSRSVEELARLHKWAVARGDSKLKGAVEKRAKDLGIFDQIKSNYPRQWNPSKGWRLLKYTGKRKKSNPENGARRFYQKFHGRDSEEELVIETEIHEHEWLGVLGILSDVVIDTPSGVQATISFDPKDAPWLCASENGKQLYIEGGNQEIDLKALQMDGGNWWKERMVLGQFSEPEGKRRWNLGYVTAKSFDKFEEILYQHDLGEVDEGEPKSMRRAAPVLEYDAVNALLFIVGGQYHIELPLFEVSPGIEN